MLLNIGHSIKPGYSRAYSECTYNILHRYLLRDFYDLEDKGEKQLDLIRVGTHTFGSTQKGPGIKPGGSTSDYLTTGDIGSQPPNVWTMEVLFLSNNITNRYICGYQESPNNNIADRRIFFNASGQLQADLFDGANKTATWGTAISGQMYHVIASTNGSNLHITANGKSSSNVTVSNGGYASYTTPEFIIGSGDLPLTAPVGCDSTILYCVVYDRYFTPGEARSITDGRSLFRHYAPTQIVLGTNASVIAPPVASLGMTGQTPVITATSDQLISIPVASLTLSGSEPIITAAGHISIDIPVASLGLAGQAPTVNATANVSIDIPSASLTLTGQAPVIVTGGNVVIDVPVASLSLVGYGPGALTPQAIDIPAADLTLSGLTPAIENGVSVNIPVGSLTLTGEIPTISATANIAINVPVGSLNLTGYAPTVIALGVVPSVPGLEYTLPVNLLHFVIPKGKLHYTMKEED